MSSAGQRPSSQSGAREPSTHYRSARIAEATASPEVSALSAVWGPGHLPSADDLPHPVAALEPGDVDDSLREALARQELRIEQVDDDRPALRPGSTPAPRRGAAG